MFADEVFPISLSLFGIEMAEWKATIRVVNEA